MPTTLARPAVAKLAETLQAAVDLMRDAAYPTNAAAPEAGEQGSLLQQCLALCELQQSRPIEALRTVHHFACTGGTLISKCIAAMPNVQLLSELDPLSTMQFNPAAKPRFVPTDMAMLMRQSTRGASEALLTELFRSELRVVHADAAGNGYRLVLRDHTHSHFCVGPQVGERPTFLELLPPELPVRSVVTVRHPVASFASLVGNKWLNFSPPTIDEYARRYLAFLDRHAGLPIMRYEDFVEQPAATMKTACAWLDLPYNEDFQDLFGVFRLSGDSGRSGERISARERRPEADTHAGDAAASASCQQLFARLGYTAA